MAQLWKWLDDPISHKKKKREGGENKGNKSNATPGPSLADRAVREVWGERIFTVIALADSRDGGGED